MKLELDPKGSFVKNGKFDQYEALKSVGVKAAVCYKETIDNKAVSPSDIRNSEADEVLITRALSTIFNDHTTPSEHQVVSLELTGIPKILCMVLNNEKQYTADERSLRYTEVEPNDCISNLEVILYRKWLNKFEQIITIKMLDFYLRCNKNEKMAKKAIHKVAQENARYMVSVFMPTTTTYTVPFIQLNKILTYMKRIIDNPLDDLEKLLVPYLKEFTNLCIDCNVAITKDSIYEVANRNEIVKEKLYSKYPDIKNYRNNNELIYKNNKDVDLSLFAKRNRFTAINCPNEYGHIISYNNYESFACLAQEHRHRTIECEMIVPNQYRPFIPPIIKNDTNVVIEWIYDMTRVKSIYPQSVYPQGQLVKVNRIMSVKNMLKYVSQERACDMAQLEIQQVYTRNIVPDTYNALVASNNLDLAEKVEPYVKKLRCQFPGYKCPNPCHHPRLNRNI